MAIVRHWTPWLSPEHGTDKFSPVKDVILCSFLRHDGTHLVLLALSGVDNVLNVLRSDEDGNVICAARNDSTEMGIARIIASVGTDYESAVAAVMYHARRVIQEEGVTSDDAEEEAKAFLDGVKPEWMENWYDGLTYCTWNGLGQNLSEQKVVDALRSLKQQNVNITNLIIDDNWQSLDNVGSSQFIQGWAEFEANKQGFPNGLKEAITKIREEHSYIQHIAVWHALLGYWGGIAPNSKLDKTYKTIDVRMKKAVRPPGGMMRVVAEEDVKRFYEDFYKFLLDAGIDSVKTDAQFFLDTLDDADDRRSLIKAYQDAWTVSSLRWFSIKAISCMSQTPQILFHSQLPMNRPRILVRNSGDFYPDVPESHPWHIFCNAHNSLLTQNLNLLPDWDMFQTAHPWASFHAAARCVSGGPVYITDEPNKHDLEIIHQMTAQSVRGSTVILRPAVGRTTQQYLNYHAARLLKIGTYVGMASTGTGILGVFNISTAPLTELLQLSEFPGVHTDEEYVVRAHSTGAVSGVMATPSLLSIDVALHGWEILSAHPIQTLGDKKVAPLGLVGKMTGVAAIVNSTSQLQPSGRVHMSIALKALGVLGIYISTLPTITPEDEILILILGKVIPLHTVRAREEVLEIDVLRAWTEMDLSAGWGNEVVVEVFVS
ncbi:MAG: hypothetical protein M1832_000817 [Thelocarpon impressellum]|nr:MAG: hypothetical protein M1832_000817 [Thelocarpon impressellum]